MSTAALFRWNGDALVELDHCDPAEDRLEAADSLLVSDGLAFAPALHRARFLAAAHARGAGLDGYSDASAAAVWNAAVALLPATGDWFPRVEILSHDGTARFQYRHRSAPDRTRSVRLITHRGPDSRTAPAVKGPDLDALLAARTAAQGHGADDVVLLTPDGYVIDGGTSAIVWWRGDILCGPPPGADDEAFARVDSVTAAGLFTLAAALGVETHRERTTPAELDGAEVWALGALHGIRMVTHWVDGPELAELPGRIGVWRDRRSALRKPIGEHTP
ncbi:branched-subunit amino acid aminotransferase/4-amino-4-deoxychorismate lyase [Cryobacterium mesophilum]|uniref:Branched-chain-amino-acid aminotransferase n=1 Tax=Terrimesophilobacter mesophilus TaxID=433647 RepID=A0A4R8VAR6_9MICO|nr:aminotransferase class IV [Terrimesophilobacter mesophilus]MBB5632272.1 branched-subunit amino acid aminotransferase/4-amino-4-deoxychorismate lyase [Terrimesophilobacter mesophilus]TFB79122.1 hypothetical protein E3N84_03045 [Terrimesophilobacter mesophilus]